MFKVGCCGFQINFQLQVGCFLYGFSCNVDCLQSAFSLKIHQVLISASAIADNDVTTWVTRGVILQRKIRDCWQSTHLVHSPTDYLTLYISNVLTWLFGIKFFVCRSRAMFLRYPRMTRKDKMLSTDSAVKYHFLNIPVGSRTTPIMANPKLLNLQNISVSRIENARTCNLQLRNKVHKIIIPFFTRELNDLSRLARAT